MVAEAEDFDFISEEDALNLVNFVKEDLDERIRNIDNTEVIAGLVEKTETLTSDVASMKEGVTSTEDTVSEKAFDDFKFIVAGYVKTIEELKKLTDALTDTSLSHSTSILDLETAFGLVEDKLRDHDEQLTKFEENLGSMDHKFTNLISDLEDDVATAIDLARAAYTFATV
jgi:chromosome segregation ATPase